MANNYIEWSFAVSITPEELSWWDKRIDEQGVDEEMNIGCSDRETDYIWFYNEGQSGDIDELIEVLHEFLIAFPKHEPIKFSWAEFCDKPRLDEFGGGSAYISQDTVRTLSTNELYDILRDGAYIA